MTEDRPEEPRVTPNHVIRSAWCEASSPRRSLEVLLRSQQFLGSPGEGQGPGSRPPTSLCGGETGALFPRGL